MAAGRGFSRDFATDTTQAMVLNEAAVKMFGYTSPQQAIGRKFKQWGREGKIIGVMKDFHFHSLQQPIKPLSMRIEPGGSNLVSANVAAANLPSTILPLKTNGKHLFPTGHSVIIFLMNFLTGNTAVKSRFGKLFLNFAILAIIHFVPRPYSVLLHTALFKEQKRSVYVKCWEHLFPIL